MRTFILLFLSPVILFLHTAQMCKAQTTLVLSSIPETTPPNAEIFLAGDFNQWNPADTAFQLHKNDLGKYAISLASLTGMHACKFTRGDWDKVETDANGMDISNRSLAFGDSVELALSVLGWADLFQGTGNSTATENVSIIDLEFSMPQLERTRRIWLYLPPDYNTSVKTYPVFYLHDGQNLFDNNTSFAGEWRVDETLNSVAANSKTVPIVVGIDNGGSHRIDEYCPWVNQSYGGGEGDLYIQFIIETLKPFIDKNYRTKTEAASTGIFGSSLGGLISQYAALRYPEVFGLTGVFSPAFWINQQIFDSSFFKQIKPHQKFYLLGGDRESESMVPQMKQMESQLKQFGATDNQVIAKVVVGGQHNEYLWSSQFKEAIEWLLYAPDIPATDTISTGTLYPVPANEILKFTLQDDERATKVEVLSANGNRLLVFKNLQDNIVNVSDLESGMYFLRVFYDENSFVKRFVKQ